MDGWLPLALGAEVGQGFSIASVLLAATCTSIAIVRSIRNGCPADVLYRNYRILSQEVAGVEVISTPRRLSLRHDIAVLSHLLSSKIFYRSILVPDLVRTLAGYKKQSTRCIHYVLKEISKVVNAALRQTQGIVQESKAEVPIHERAL